MTTIISQNYCKTLNNKGRRSTPLLCPNSFNKSVCRLKHHFCPFLRFRWTGVMDPKIGIRNGKGNPE